jgi:hypothetical protein
MPPLVTRLLLSALFPLGASASGPRLAELPQRPRELTEASLRLADSAWDDRAGLLWASPAQRAHPVRPTAWYTVGLLLRDEPGDRERADRALAAVLREQIEAPGQAWHGTFQRRAEETQPRPGARMWEDYDPNWRQFIGCAFAQILLHFEDRLEPAMVKRLEDSIIQAIEGELAEGRLSPHYTNISLMHGFLLGFAGERFHRPEWTAAADQWMEIIATTFAIHRSFEEYNAPTYYGVDLYALGLLRAHGATATLRKVGSDLEQDLWRDMARFYHAGLGNLCGPYDRAVGMDMSRYVALSGIWLGFLLSTEATPLPDLHQPLAHGSDFLFTPCFALIEPQLPEETREHFSRFVEERWVERPIHDGRRVATAWLAENIMIGGQFTDRSRDVRDPDSRFHPATVHWKDNRGQLNWISLRQSSRVDARAEPGMLKIEAIGDALFRIHVADTASQVVSADHWHVAGLAVAVETDATEASIERHDDFIDISYRRATRFTLRFNLTSQP